MKFEMCSRLEKKRNTLINSNANYRREMKLVPINMDFCLHQFDALTHSLPLTRWRVSMALPPMPVTLWADNRV